jgi:hypothetical protein
MSSSVLLKIIGSMAAILVLSLVGYAFNATNAVSTSNAGDGSGTISGLAITAVHHTLNTTNPANIDSLTFTINPSPATANGTVKVKTPSAGSWVSCGFSGTTVTCPSGSALSGVTVASLDNLEVVAAD